MMFYQVLSASAALAAALAFSAVRTHFFRTNPVILRTAPVLSEVEGKNLSYIAKKGCRFVRDEVTASCTPRYHPAWPVVADPLSASARMTSTGLPAALLTVSFRSDLLWQP